ncbi:MAG: endonuclease [Actinomycetia bacterium]|nr:endonuclease [Actinomycetes bacterium]
MCLPEQSARDAALAELARLDPAALDAALLMDQITGLATFISQAQGQLARLTATLDATGGAAEAGHKSASAFLRTRCGLAPGRAAAVVATARGLRDREATEKALDAGVISFDQAQLIVQATTGLGDAAGPAEQVLLDHAPGLDTARLRQFADEVAYRANPEAAEERERRRWDKRHLSFGLTLDSTGVLSGSCGDAVCYEIVRTAAEAFSPPGGQADTRTAAQRRMDGLVAACKAALDGGSAPERHGAAPHITVLVKDETLAQAARAGQDTGPRHATGADSGPGQTGAAQSGQNTGTPGRSRTGAPPGLITGPPPAQTGHGTFLTARQVLALCCGAQVGAIRWRDGLPLGLGRTARTEPRGLRRALEARDRRCRWPGCDALAAWATAHHIRPWSKGGATSLEDLALFCHVHHHHFIHSLGWTITGNPNATLHFTHPGGWLTLDSPLPAG